MGRRRREEDCESQFKTPIPLSYSFLVSCSPRVCLPARNGLVYKVEFLGLIPQNGGRPMKLRGL